MKDNRILKYISGNIIVVGTLSAIVIFSGCYYFLLNNSDQIDFWNVYIDTSLKITVAIVGMLWILNRYYKTRQDISKLQVESSAFGVNTDGDHKILNYNIKVVNDSNVQIRNLKYQLEIGQYETKNNPTKESCLPWVCPRDEFGFTR